MLKTLGSSPPFTKKNALATPVLSAAESISSDDIKLLDTLSKTILKEFLKEFEKLSNINKESLEKIINELIKKYKTNFKGVGQPMRIALVGSKFGPGIYDTILSLDKNEVIGRLKAVS